MTLEEIQVVDKNRKLEGQTPIKVISSSYLNKNEFERYKQLFKYTFSQPFTRQIYIPRRYRDSGYEKRTKYMSISGLETEYIFDNSWAIRKFLNKNDFLIDPLYEIPTHIHQIFGHISTHLKHVVDPEGDFEGFLYL